MYYKYNILNFFILTIFFLCYILIIFEEFFKVKKSLSAIILSSFVWFIITIFFQDKKIIEYYIKNFIFDYFNIFLFLFIVMLYINTIKEFNILNKIKYEILNKNLSYKKIYWIIGFLSFFLSPIIDNLTTALFTSSILLSLEKKNKKFIKLTLITIIIAVNSGGAFSPFGDITTLILWQNKILEFYSFFYIFIPSLISFLIPALIIYIKIPSGYPEVNGIKKQKLKSGAITIILIFILTIIITIITQLIFFLPPTMGMVFGVGLLYIFEYTENKKNKKFKVIKQINNIDLDTLFFFYGILLFINALSITGILNNLYILIYKTSNENTYTVPNIIIGLLSSLIDNIPLTLAVLNMKLDMTQGQWLLLTLAVGTGGSLLPIGSAAGIALMGKTNGIYTFFEHLKWSWAILLGYIISIFSHMEINKHLF